MAFSTCIPGVVSDLLLVLVISVSLAASLLIAFVGFIVLKKYFNNFDINNMLSSQEKLTGSLDRCTSEYDNTSPHYVATRSYPTDDDVTFDTTKIDDPFTSRHQHLDTNDQDLHFQPLSSDVECSCGQHAPDRTIDSNQPELSLQ